MKIPVTLSAALVLSLVGSTEAANRHAGTRRTLNIFSNGDAGSSAAHANLAKRVPLPDTGLNHVSDQAGMRKLKRQPLAQPAPAAAAYAAMPIMGEGTMPIVGLTKRGEVEAYDAHNGKQGTHVDDANSSSGSSKSSSTSSSSSSSPSSSSNNGSQSSSSDGSQVVSSSVSDDDAEECDEDDDDDAEDCEEDDGDEDEDCEDDDNEDTEQCDDDEEEEDCEEDDDSSTSDSSTSSTSSSSDTASTANAQVNLAQSKQGSGSNGSSTSNKNWDSSDSDSSSSSSGSSSSSTSSGNSSKSSSSSSSGSQKGDSFKGTATWYRQNGVAGACGTVAQESDKVIALYTSAYDGGKNCGRTVMIKNLDDGTSTSARVADMCPSCGGPEDIDLSIGAFSAMDPQYQTHGVRNIEWYYTS